MLLGKRPLLDGDDLEDGPRAESHRSIVRPLLVRSEEIAERDVP